MLLPDPHWCTRQPTGQKEKMNGSKVSSRVENGGTVPYPPHWPLDQCLIAYQAGRCIRGTLRVLPFTPSTAATTSSFVSCDRGLHSRDICVATAWDRNRALDGDIVFVEIIDGCDEQQEGIGHDVVSEFSNIRICEDEDLGANNQAKEEGHESMWQDDPVQVDLWNPVVPIKRPRVRPSSLSFDNTTNRRREKELREQRQCKGRVVHVCPPKPVFSEMHPEKKQLPTRRIVGSLKILNNNTILLTPNNRSLPQFRCPPESTKKLIGSMQSKSDAKSNEAFNFYYQAEYVFGSWKETFNWPPCTRVKVLGEACILEDEIQALLTEYDVNHGEFSGAVLKNVNDAVQSGVFQDQDTLGWKPTPEMYKGRRDYRTTRIFTIDPTTAKDLDDALHITRLDDGTLEVGVHIADVSFFVKPETPVDKEAQLRATTVYLVDRTIPMLPRPLCEVACSLNENVERLAFSCVWRMNMDGTMVRSNNHDFVWYGRTVIKSCARLDYATAQNIIEGKVAFGEAEEDIPESLWPKSRRPVGFSIDEVAADVRLMHRVAVARRRLRFQNGAIALNGIKLTFQLDSDGRTPLLTAPYPIRDSNRLVEEMMLLANFLVAQRLITHAGDRALLRNHGDPQMEKLDDLAVLVKATLGFDLDCTTSQSLHSSLVRIGRECSDPLILQCITQLVMSPMVPADYIAAGQSEREEWRHFALNIP